MTRTRRRYHGQHRRRSLRGVVALALALLSLVGLALPGAYGGYVARIVNGKDTAASAPYLTCTSAASTGTPKAWFAYPLGENSAVSVTATDVSGNNRPGTYNSLASLPLVPIGVQQGQTNTGATAVCPRDRQTTTSFNGSTGYVSGPTTAIDGPNTFSVEIWFKTTVAQGKLIGFGDARTGTSARYDRHLYIGANGRLVFGVYPNAVKTVTSPAAVTDGNWHYAVGTLSSAGMVLYLDGKAVASDNTVTTGQAFPGYWRIAYDNLNSWTNQPTSGYFNGSLAFAAAYLDVLTPAQVAQHFVAGD